MSDPFEEVDEAKKNFVPTLSPVTFERFVETHRRTLPGRIDRSVMPNMSGGDQTKIINALHFLKLTHQRTDVPTTLFERMRDAKDDENSLKAVWGDVLRGAYPMAFIEPFDLLKATQGQLNENFTQAFGISGDSVRKATAFFISLARTAGLPLSGYFRQTRKRSGTKAGAERKAGAARNTRRGQAQGESGSHRDTANGYGTVAALWRLSNGGTVKLVVTGDAFSLSKDERDALFAVADMLKSYDATSTNPAFSEAGLVLDGAAES